VFNGDQTAIAPDIVVIPADGYDLKAGFTDKDKVFATGPPKRNAQVRKMRAYSRRVQIST